MNREELLAINDRQIEPVVVGTRTFRVRSMSCSELVDFDAAIKGCKLDVKEILAVQLSSFLCDETGNQVVSLEDARKLCAGMSGSTVKAIAEAGSNLNGIGESAREDLKGKS